MLSERIVTICSDAVTFFDGRKVHEMRWSVNFVVKLLGIGQMQLVLHVGVVTDAHEIVVPRALARHHEEAEELVRQQHLDSLVVRREVALGVVATISVLLAPLETAGRQLVGHQRARAGRETGRDDHSLLAVPGGVVGHHLGMRRYVLRRQLWQLVGLCAHPAEGLQVFKVLVLRQLDGQVDRLMRSPLRRHHDATNLLHLWIVRRTDALQVAGDLGAQVRNGNKHLQHVLGQNVRVARLLDRQSDET